MTGFFTPTVKAKFFGRRPAVFSLGVFPPVRTSNPTNRASANRASANRASANRASANRASTAKDDTDSTELQLRAAAMTNLQQQLARVESLRADELKTAISRFEELEEALSMAERTILDLERENAAIKAAARQELAESQALVQKAMQVIEALKEVEDEDEEEEGTGSAASPSAAEAQGAVTGARDETEGIIEDLEAELGQLHEIIASLSVGPPHSPAAAVPDEVSFEVPPMLSVSELESVVGKLTESQRNLAAAEKDNALLRARVEALERADREAGVVARGAGQNSDKLYVRDLEVRNRELARLLGGSEAGLEEGTKLLRGVLERLKEEE